MPRPIQPTLADLREMSTAALRAEWRRHVGTPPPCPTSREFLLYTLAWQRQADQHGGLSLAVQRQLKVMRDLPRSRRTSPQTTRPPVTPGTILHKTWKGQGYTVTVEAKGYRFQEQTYASLSEIARVITGTRWNGPAFFGLRRKGSSKNMGDPAA